MKNIIIAVATATTGSTTVKYEDHLRTQYQWFTTVDGMDACVVQSHLTGMTEYQAGDCLEYDALHWGEGCQYDFTSQNWAAHRAIFRGCCPEPVPTSPLYNLRIALNKCTFPAPAPIKLSRIERFLRWFMI
jgi:hypothetical protein